MIQRSLVFSVMVAALFLGIHLPGCVEIPSEGHTPPDYQAEVRIVYADPYVGMMTISMAPGPNFDSYSDLPAGPYGSATTTYSTVPAGNKKLFAKNVDHDTSSIAYLPDQHGTMIVFPRPDSTVSRFLWISERYVFAQGGIADTTRVLFVNAIARGVADTADVSVDVGMISRVDTLTMTSTPVTALAFHDIYYYVNIPAGDTVDFYLTLAGTSTVISDTVEVVGSSQKDVTFVAHDSLSVGKVEFMKLDNN
jgi:hypothetical protein